MYSFKLHVDLDKVFAEVGPAGYIAVEQACVLTVDLSVTVYVSCFPILDILVVAAPAGNVTVKNTCVLTVNFAVEVNVADQNDSAELLNYLLLKEPFSAACAANALGKTCMVMSCGYSRYNLIVVTQSRDRLACADNLSAGRAVAAVGET